MIDPLLTGTDEDDPRPQPTEDRSFIATAWPLWIMFGIAAATFGIWLWFWVPTP